MLSYVGGKFDKVIDKELMTQDVINSLVAKFKARVMFELNDPEFMKEMKRLRNELYFTRGYSKDKTKKLVAKIPPNTYAMMQEVFGPEVFTDWNYFLKVMYSDEDLRKLMLLDRHKI